MKNSNLQYSQRGATLIVSLVLLLAVTVVGIASMKESVTQQKVVNSIVDDNAAFQSSEGALRAGEKYLTDLTLNSGALPTMGDAGIVADEQSHRYSSADQRNDLDNKWWEQFNSDEWSNGIDVTDYPTISAAQQVPKYAIEILQRGEHNRGSVDPTLESGKVATYRVTARGFGAESNTSVILQTTYAVQN